MRNSKEVAMSEKHFFTVRTQIKYVLTHAVQGADFGSVGTLAEFSSFDSAAMVARALNTAHPGSELDLCAAPDAEPTLSPTAPEAAPSVLHGHDQ